jgi:hypothetical protein
MMALLSASARADVQARLVPELRLGAGYDDNLFLDPNLAGSTPARGDAIFDVEPRLVGQLTARRHALTLQLDYLERLTPSTGDVRDLWVRLDWRSPSLGRLQLLASAFYKHYEVSDYPDNAFDLGGGELGARLQAGERVRLEARYGFDARVYSDPSRAGQLDRSHHASVAAHARLHRRVEGQLAYTYLHVDSDSVAADLDRHRGDLALSVQPFAWLRIDASYGFAFQHLPNGIQETGPMAPRDDLLHEVAAQLTARPLRWLELFARYDLLLSRSSSSTGVWQRNQLLAGVQLFVDLEKRWTRPAPLAPVLHDREVVFRYRGPARQVAVIGDWNDWNPTASPLAARGGAGDRYEGTYTLPSGRHEYALSVDGVPVAPPDAQSYVPDGFGGRNGVVIVP